MRRILLAWTFAVLIQGILSFAGVGLGSLVVTAVLGHSLLLPTLLLLPCFAQVALMGWACYRLLTGWPWVRFALASTYASLVPASIALSLVVDELRRPTPEGPNAFLHVIMFSYALPIGLMVWLLKRKTTDEWGKDIGTERRED